MNFLEIIKEIGAFGLIVSTFSILSIGLTVISMIRNKIIASMSFRNIFRRKTTTILVIIGSMVGTALITGSLVLKDSFNKTGDQVVIGMLGEIDAIITPTIIGDSFGTERAQEIVSEIREMDSVDDVLAMNYGTFSIREIKEDLTEEILLSECTFLSGDLDRFSEFGSDNSINELVKEPKEGSVIISQSIANKSDIKKGDTIKVYAFPQTFEFKVSDIYEPKGATGFRYNGSNPGTVIVNKKDLNQMLFYEDQRSNIIFISAEGGIYPTDFDDGEFKKTINNRLKGSLGLSDEEYTYTGVKDNIIKTISDNGLGDAFLIMSFFGIVAGGLLIINLYSMLAEERKGEMGMLRAVAFTRQKLIRLYAYEGFFYSFLSSLVGVLVGVGLGYLLVEALSTLIGEFMSQFGIDARIVFGISPLSILMAFVAGLFITYLTVVIASMIISRLNIVSAIRGLKEEKKKQSVLIEILSTIFLLAMTFQGIALYISADKAQEALEKTGSEVQIDGFLIYGGLILTVIMGGFLLNKILSFILKGKAKENASRSILSIASLFSLGYSVYVYGLSRFQAYVETMEAAVFFFMTGFVLIVAASIFITYNLELLINLSQWLLSPYRKIIATIKIALRYPIEKRGRTGLTLTMFSMIVFFVVYVSISSASSEAMFKGFTDSMLAGYDAVISLTEKDPYDEVKKLVEKDKDVTGISDVISFKAQFPDEEVLPVALGGVSFMGPSLGSEGIYSDSFAVVDENVLYKISDEFYDIKEGLSKEEVWPNLGERKDAVVLGAMYGSEEGKFPIPDWSAGDKISFTYPGTKIKVEKEIIAIVNPSLSTFFILGNIIIPDESVENDFISANSQEVDSWKDTDDYPNFQKESNILIDYKKNTRVGDEVSDLRKDLAKMNVLQVLAPEEFVASLQVFVKQTIYLMQGYLAFGLLVGLAGLAVIMMRSVTERKQQIGMLRSLGFTRKMVLQSFLIESSFIAILGITLGVVTGSIAAVSYMEAASKKIEGLELVYPYTEIAVLMAIVYFGSLFFATLPAIRASRLDPVEATNYPE